MIRRKLTGTGLLVLLALVFVVPGAGQMAGGYGGNCSLATLYGAYGGIEKGTIVGQIPGLPPPPFPMVVAPLGNYDGAGNFSGTFWASFGGTIVTGPFAGTYTVNRDCTYQDEFSPIPGLIVHHSGTITGGAMFREINYMYTDAGVVVMGAVKKIPLEGCSLATFKGTYALFGDGIITQQLPGLPPPPFPAAHSGILASDGAGNFYGDETESIAGFIVPDTFTATYTVNPDCTESATITTSSGLVVHETGTITGIGRRQEIHKIVTDAGWVLADTAKKR